MLFIRRKKNLKIKKSKKIFIQEKFFDFETFFSSLKNKLIYLSIRIFIKTEKFKKQEYLIEHPSKFISRTKI
ncbi:hypothetical protein BpHYR1_031847 [Brachionus plicatilis]|uniref:Uncharacterized protein n=1 Tax=Brachionus plicatilis TaxID=10195 RepID=A0A3M7QXX2_BRAPC|nr:hypothetical protein BpHYR1_031847 [Brachionus plicatilis]